MTPKKDSIFGIRVIDEYEPVVGLVYECGYGSTIYLRHYKVENNSYVSENVEEWDDISKLIVKGSIKDAINTIKKTAKRIIPGINIYMCEAFYDSMQKEIEKLGELKKEGIML